MIWWNRKSILNLLSECCICRTQAAVMFPAVQTLCRGEFTGLDEKTLTIQLFPNEKNELRVDCLCCVTFNCEYRPHVFLTSVVDFGAAPTNEPRRLVLEVPAQVLVDKRRIAFRVPVEPDAGLHVVVKGADGQTWTPAVRNVSVAGMLVEFASDNAPDWVIGSMLEVFLQLAHHEVVVRAEVKRRDKQSYGLYFPDSVFGDRLNPPAELDGIVRALERSWYQGG
jgi:hypothetical protein